MHDVDGLHDSDGDRNSSSTGSRGRRGGGRESKALSLARPANSSLFVRNVSDRATMDDLRELFRKFGPLFDVYIPRDFHSKRPRGFAYVQFQDPEDAEHAQRQLHHALLYDKRLEVDFAKGDRKTPYEMKHQELEDRIDRRPSPLHSRHHHHRNQHHHHHHHRRRVSHSRRDRSKSGDRRGHHLHHRHHHHHHDESDHDHHHHHHNHHRHRSHIHHHHHPRDDEVEKGKPERKSRRRRRDSTSDDDEDDDKDRRSADHRDNDNKEEDKNGATATSPPRRRQRRRRFSSASSAGASPRLSPFPSTGSKDDEGVDRQRDRGIADARTQRDSTVPPGESP